MLVLLSGVSGAGKDTIKKELIKRMENVESLPSYTDRPMRPGDEPGKTYHFVTTEEFERLHSEFKRKTTEYEEARIRQENLIKQLFKNGVISAGRLKTMQDCAELKEIDRHTLCSMVKRIDVYENKRIEITFYYTDRFRIMQEINQKNSNEDKIRVVRERSA